MLYIVDVLFLEFLHQMNELFVCINDMIFYAQIVFLEQYFLIFVILKPCDRVNWLWSTEKLSKNFEGVFWFAMIHEGGSV